MGTLAFLQGAASEDVQKLLRDFGAGLIAHYVPIAGMTEILRNEADDNAVLEDLISHRTFQIFQDLGKLSEACSLDSTGLSEAAGFLEAQMNEDTQLLIINKFGKEEAATRGFCSVFRKALLLDIPVLTSVNPNFNAEWQDFSGGLAASLAPSLPAIADWWAGAKRLD